METRFRAKVYSTTCAVSGAGGSRAEWRENASAVPEFECYTLKANQSISSLLRTE